MKRTSYYLFAFLPSAIIVFIMVVVKPQLPDWLIYLPICLLPAILIALLWNAGKELKGDDKLALAKLEERLNTIPIAERFGVALAQPLRSTQLTMPLGGLYDINYSLYEAGCLQIQKSRWQARQDLRRLPELYDYLEWTVYVSDCILEISKRQEEAALGYCWLCHLIVCAIDVGAIDIEEGVELLTPIERKVLQHYSSWNDYHHAIRKDIFSSKSGYSFRGKLGFRIHFRDLRKSPVSPCNLLSWDEVRMTIAGLKQVG